MCLRLRKRGAGWGDMGDSLMGFSCGVMKCFGTRGVGGSITL